MFTQQRLENQAGQGQIRHQRPKWSFRLGVGDDHLDANARHVARRLMAGADEVASLHVADSLVGEGLPSPHPTEGVAPVAGEEYSVSIGESFSHDTDHRFHALRYDFKPGSIVNDEARDGQLLLSGERNAESARVQFQHKKGSNRRVVCRGRRRAGKDNEVLLIFDPRTRTFVLERVSGVVTNLRHERDPEDLALADEEQHSVAAAAAAAAANRSDSDSDDSLSDFDSDSDSDSDGGVPATATPGKAGRMRSYGAAGSEGGTPLVAKKPRLEPDSRKQAAGSAVAGDSSDLSDSGEDD